MRFGRRNQQRNRKSDERVKMIIGRQRFGQATAVSTTEP